MEQVMMVVSSPRRIQQHHLHMGNTHFRENHILFSRNKASLFTLNHCDSTDDQEHGWKKSSLLHISYPNWSFETNALVTHLAILRDCWSWERCYQRKPICDVLCSPEEFQPWWDFKSLRRIRPWYLASIPGQMFSAHLTSKSMVEWLVG
jgi:hypothetical protein